MVSRILYGFVFKSDDMFLLYLYKFTFCSTVEQKRGYVVTLTLYHTKQTLENPAWFCWIPISQWKKSKMRKFGRIFSSSHSLWVYLQFPLLKFYKSIIPRRKLRKQCPMGSTWQSFHFICDWWTKIDYLNFAAEIRLFENLKNLYPPKGKCESTPAGVQLISLDLN